MNNKEVDTKHFLYSNQWSCLVELNIYVLNFHLFLRIFVIKSWDQNLQLEYWMDGNVIITSQN